MSTVDVIKQVELMAPFMDKHLLYPMLTFAEKQGVDTLDAKIKVAGMTHMCDVSIDLLEMKGGNESKAAIHAIEAQKVKLTKSFEGMQKSLAPIISKYFVEDDQYRLRFTDAELDEQKKNGDLSVSTIATALSVPASALDELFAFARQMYEFGWPLEASNVLHFLMFVSGTKVDEITLLWGLLASNQGAGKWSEALSNIQRLQDFIESPTQHTWLLHWALFTFFKGGKVGAMLTMLYQPDLKDRSYLYQNVIECCAPHLFRYFAAAAILKRGKRSDLGRAAAVAERSSYCHSDIMFDFVRSCMTTRSFADSCRYISEMKEMLQGDYFLCDLADEIVDSAWKIVFEDFLKMHAQVSIPFVAEKMGKGVVECEMWLANLIRESKTDAKIDSVKQIVSVKPVNRSLLEEMVTRLEVVDRPAFN